MLTASRTAFIAFTALIAVLQSSAPAAAQLIDTPAHLIKTWADAYASRRGDPMARVYARDAFLVAATTKEPLVGIDAIKQHYDRSGQAVVERSVAITKMQTQSRKRITQVVGSMELRSKLKDGTVRSVPVRFSMSIVRESRRAWTILNHHISRVAE